MTKTTERNKTVKLRLKGKSISEISKLLNIRWGTISKWCKQIPLSSKQQAYISLQTRINGQKKLNDYYGKKRKVKELIIDKIQKTVFNDIKTLSNNELFLMGTMLYWAEGFKSKSEHRLGFCNSDPNMILFYIKWLKHCLHIKEKEITLRLTLNYSYKNKVSEIEESWSKILKLPRNQFTKPFFQKTKWLKNYANKEQYRGVLRIHVRKSVKLLWRILASIDRIKKITL